MTCILVDIGPFSINYYPHSSLIFQRFPCINILNLYRQYNYLSLVSLFPSAEISHGFSTPPTLCFPHTRYFLALDQTPKEKYCFSNKEIASWSQEAASHWQPSQALRWRLTPSRPRAPSRQIWRSHVFTTRLSIHSSGLLISYGKRDLQNS